MDTSNIDRLLQQAADDGAVPGVVAVAGDREGTIYQGAFGRLSVEGEQPARTDTIFLIASMTKAIASVAALQLVEQGLLDLQQPVSDILPEFAELQVLDGFDGDEPRLRPPARQATIRNLLTHTSGLAYWFSNEDALRYSELMGIPDPSTGLRATFELPLVHDPGTRWEYGISTDWLGLLIGEVSGEDLATYCGNHIFAPLGMEDSTFLPSGALRERLMVVHSRTADGGLVEAPFPVPEEPEFFSGGGGAASTAGDYLRFMRALLRNGELDGERVLREETVELMFSDHLDGISLPDVMRSAVPELSNDVPANPFRDTFGLGLHIVLEDMPGMRRAGTGDWAGLFNCYYWIDRASGVAGAFLTQVLPFFDGRIVETALGYEIAVYAEVGAPAAA
jgi:CubicO group peptidase (beta-lactamase class C family)